ncbi:MAG TPA: class I SAM-dependent methyltransferase [Thermoplasmata archaeon]|nr:class I SAM-dependent methyltransferase [Thermoplasmata archaeon]
MNVDWEAIALLVGLIIVVLYFVFGSFACGAGYQPTFRPVVARMLELARVGPDDTVYDLGAGTGAILFRAARERGARVVGVEIEPVRVLLLRLRRWFGGPRDRVDIRWGNLYETDLRAASVVALFLWPEAMRRLRPRLESDLRSGARVVTHWHEVPGWTPVATDTDLRVYLYVRGPSEPMRATGGG